MKKNFSVVCCILFLSIILHVTGVSASTRSYLSNFHVAAWGGGSMVTTLDKTVNGPEKLNVAAYFNRDLKARIVATNSGNYNGDSGYAWNIKISGESNPHTLGSDLNSTSSTYAYFTGSKTLYLKTAGFWYDTTSVSGVWDANGNI